MKLGAEVECGSGVLEDAGCVGYSGSGRSVPGPDCFPFEEQKAVTEQHAVRHGKFPARRRAAFLLNESRRRYGVEGELIDGLEACLRNPMAKDRELRRRAYC